jgi:hypothetical protein
MNLNPAVRPRDDVTSWRSEARCEVADGELGKNSSAINGFDMNAFMSCVAIHKAINVRKSQPARVTRLVDISSKKESQSKLGRAVARAARETAPFSRDWLDTSYLVELVLNCGNRAEPLQRRVVVTTSFVTEDRIDQVRGLVFNWTLGIQK